MGRNDAPGTDLESWRRKTDRLRLAVVGLGVAWLASFAWLAFRPAAVPPVLAVERLEIVESDGTPALVFANSDRPAVATMDGRVIMAGQEEERRGVPSIIFYDGKGDEVGGMLLGVRETPDGFQATRHLSLDGYKQDQTVVLSHYQNESGSSAGLRVSDRPLDLSIPDAFARLGLEVGASRADMEAAVGAFPENGRADLLRELFGVSRVFVGSTRDRDAAVILNDGRGRPRIVISVPAEGDPSIRVLDEAGEEVFKVPASPN